MATTVMVASTGLTEIQIRVFLHQPSVMSTSSPPTAPDQEFPLEVQARGGLELLKFQISSLVAIDPRDQMIYYGPSGFLLRDDLDLEATLLANTTTDAPALTVLRRPDVMAWQSVCTKALLGSTAAIQPAFLIPGGDESQMICHACAHTCFPPGLCVPIQSGNTVKSFVCGSMALCEVGLGAYAWADRFPPSAADATTTTDQEASSSPPSPPSSPPPPVPILALLSACQMAAFEQQASGFLPNSAEAQHMARRLQSSYETVKAYEDPRLQAKARGLIPLAVLRDRAIGAGGDPTNHDEFQDFLFRELLAWYKREFFRWVNQPPCDHCSKGTSIVGGAQPTPEEASGWAGRVEVYQCNDCKQHTRFPRYNHPGTLLDTRRGRCGEWANCFTLCCRAVGYEARYVLDWTDHVWTEVYSHAQGRWIHADSCENRSDHPMMYERGWNKKLSYIIAFGKDNVVDVTRRYTWKYPEVLTRRTDVPELVLMQQVRGLERHVRGVSGVVEGSGRARELEVRARREEVDMRENTTLGEARTIAKPGEQQGRISGDEAWKRARGEDGKGAPSSSLALGDGAECGAGGAGGGPSCAVPGMEGTSTVLNGLRLGSYITGLLGLGPPPPSSLLVSLTSVGDDDVVPGLYGSSRYHASAITINGSACAMGRRGHNVVVIDPVTGTLDGSVAFDTSVEGGGSGGGGGARLASFLAGIGDGKVVLMVVIGSGHHAAGVVEEGKGGGVIPLLPADKPKPGPKEAWVVAGVKGAEAVKWSVAEWKEAGRGPAKAVLTIPINGGVTTTQAADITKAGAAGVISMVNWVGASPLWQDVPSSSSSEGGATTTGGADDGDDYVSSGEDKALLLLRRLEARACKGDVLVKGICSKKAGGSGEVFLLGSSGVLPLRAEEGWTTTVVMGGGDGGGRSVQEEFKNLVEGYQVEGATANEAASKALMWAGAKRGGGGGPEAALRMKWSHRVGRRHADTVDFDDTEAALPYTAAAQRGQPLLPARLCEIRVWSNTTAVLGLQCVYEVGGGGTSRVEGEAHLGKEVMTGQLPSSTMVVGQGDVVVKVEVWSGDVMDGLVVHTREGRRQQWGRVMTVDMHHELTAKEGEEVIAFFGGYGGHLHNIGVAFLVAPNRQASPTSSPPLPAPPLPWGIYTSSPITRAVRILALSHGRDATIAVLQATRKYVANCQREPGNVKFRRVRTQAAFFRDKIGAFVGSGALMEALGFVFDASEGEGGGPGWEMPLVRVNDRYLSRAVAAIDANVRRVEKLPSPPAPPTTTT